MRGPAAEGLPDLGDQRPVNHLERRLCRGGRESPLLKRPKGVVVARDRGATGVAARQLGALPAVTAGRMSLGRDVVPLLTQRLSTADASIAGLETGCLTQVKLKLVDTPERRFLIDVTIPAAWSSASS